jgi:hypothetical protein
LKKILEEGSKMKKLSEVFQSVATSFREEPVKYPLKLAAAFLGQFLAEPATQTFERTGYALDYAEAWAGTTFRKSGPSL